MWSKLFRRKKLSPEAQEPVHAESYAPGTRISYDPQLIERFEDHHASLLKTFGLIHAAAIAGGDYARIQAILSRFRRLLQEHLLEENLRLYVYLDKCLANDLSSSEMVQGMKNEMGQIGRTVMTFLNHYEEAGVNQTSIEGFVAQLEKIGEALTDRIGREERSLYTLYLPPGSY